MKKHNLKIFFIKIFLIIFLFSCDKKKNLDNPKKKSVPINVSVITISPKKIKNIIELPGRIDAIRTAEVRARVTGIIRKRIFKEGIEVKKGNVLYEIDPEPLQAEFNNSKAKLFKAEASLAKANTKLKRYKLLVKSDAISKQGFDDILSEQQLALADVESAKAELEINKLNLSYARVTAPISGIIGQSLKTEGALVSQQDATKLAVIKQIDKVYVTLLQSANEMNRLKREIKVKNDKAKLTIFFEDGREYEKKGILLFTEALVDPNSGSIILRGLFPNPNRELLPGMYIRVKLEHGSIESNIMVPQQAVNLTNDGSYVMLVDSKNIVSRREVKIGKTYGTNWIIKEGLSVGEVIVVEGIQKIKSGITVNTVIWKQDNKTDKDV